MGMTWQTGIGSSDCVPDAFAQCLDLLGRDRTLAALRSLEAGIQDVFAGGSPGEESELCELAGKAHRLVSTATAVGFIDLAHACHAFEESCGSGAARAAFECARSIAGLSLREIGRLRMELRATAVP
jgi:HPt (histidine-containing phosphotransfer) domain-containing protein